MKLTFSNRMGLAEDIPTIQIDGMNNALRNSLWNFLHFLYESRNDYWIPAAN
jgi:hypothetical protein